MRIAFIKIGHAYAPEISAYQNYFTQHGHATTKLSEFDDSILREFDVEWHLMGYDLNYTRSNRHIIHEYSSLSIPPLSKLKNQLKRKINKKPHARVFGSHFIRNELNFNDEVPYFIREEAAVGSIFLNYKDANKKKEFDFVYCGTTHKSRKIEKFIKVFLKKIPSKKLLLIGEKTPNWKHEENVTFTGGVPYESVPNHLSKAQYALNIIPDISPFNHQKSLKLLEYCAMQLPIITTEYEWVNHFEKERNAAFYKLDKHYDKLDYNQIKSFSYRTPYVDDMTWKNVFDKSGLLEYINKLQK